LKERREGSMKKPKKKKRDNAPGEGKEGMCGEWSYRS